MIALVAPRQCRTLTSYVHITDLTKDKEWQAPSTFLSRISVTCSMERHPILWGRQCRWKGKTDKRQSLGWSNTYLPAGGLNESGSSREELSPSPDREDFAREPVFNSLIEVRHVGWCCALIRLHWNRPRERQSIIYAIQSSYSFGWNIWMVTYIPIGFCGSESV